MRNKKSIIEIINYETSISQFSIQHLYDFNEFKNDHQLYNQIKDVSINAYSKELEQEIHDDINMNCNASFSQRSLYNFNSSDEFEGDHHQHNITEQHDGSDSDSKVTDDLELKTGFTFTNWQEFNIWIDDLLKKKDLTIRLGLVKWKKK
ncbi:unnamed protein product [Rhizophagus irregularis]|nr:unnamed protein product [Rhizophagus irregularis]